VAFLTRIENFVEKILAALGFFSGVIAFLSSLIMTMTWLHFLVPLGLNVNVSSFLLMLSFMILVATSIVAPVVLKMVICHQLPLILGRPFLNTKLIPNNILERIFTSVEVLPHITLLAVVE
jgi:membrane-associated phospholipid phosphatase